MKGKNRVAHFDCQFGAAGDMLLGALVDACDSFARLEIELSKIALPAKSFVIRAERVTRCGLAAIKIHVLDEEHTHEHHGHTHEHHEHPHQSEHTHAPMRNLSAILEIIRASGISENAKKMSQNIFQRIAKAEANVHGVGIDEIHFHELGGIDAIVDIVGFSIAFELAGVDYVSCTPVPLGSGTVNTAHGNYPVPAPAVLELLQDGAAHTSGLSIPFECLTPTGAAILCEIVQGWGVRPAFLEITGTGYGAGSKDPSDWPNTCRVLLGISGADVSKESSARFESEPVSIVEANVDDQSPQALAFAVERLVAAGALDVFVTPVLMKKGRSGQLITVICQPDHESIMQELIMTETSSIGARVRRESRLLAARRWEELILEDGGRVRMKLASDRKGNVVNAQPEFEDLASYALSRGISIKEAQARVLAAFQAQNTEIARAANQEAATIKDVGNQK